MKLNIVARNNRFGIEVKNTTLMSEVKQLIADILTNNTSKIQGNARHDKESFCLIHNGIYLSNVCTVSEIGLTSGSTLRYKTNRRTPYTLKVLVRCLSTFVEFRDEVCIQKTTIWDVRRLLQNKLGIPVSIFTLHEMDNNRVLFDNRQLSYYGISTGDTLVLAVWKGTRNLLLAAMDGDISRTLSVIPSYQDYPYLNRYYLRVVLFIAAHMDFVNLAAQILQRGARCNEAVGEHPFREWCTQQSHTDIRKTPIHQAAMKGSFRTLSMFIRHNPACVVAKDGEGHLPNIHAWNHHHAQCWKLIIATQEEVRMMCYFNNLTLTMYSRIMSWYHRAKDRVLYFKAENKKQILVQAKLSHSVSCCVGNPIVVFGLREKENYSINDGTRLRRSSAWSYNMQNGSQMKERDNSLISKNVADKNLLKSRGRSSMSHTKSHYKGISGRPLYEGRLEAKKIIYEKTGKTMSQIAYSCFQMGQAFENMKWRSQMNVALKCSVNCIKNDLPSCNMSR